MKRLAVFLVVLALVPAAAASAGSITVSLISSDVPVQFSINGGASWTSTYAGEFRITPTGLSPLANNVALNGFCVDLLHWLRSPVETTLDDMADWADAAYGNPADPSAGRRAAFLAETYAPGDAKHQAALQLAVWEVLFETSGSYSLTAGTARFRNEPADVLSYAAGYLASLPANVSGYDAWWLRTTDFAGGYSQDYMVPMPEPGSMALLGTGLLGLAALVRRRFAR